MKRQKVYIWLIFSMFIPVVLLANQSIEELEKKLEKVSGKEKVEVLNDLAYVYYDISIEKVLEYGKQALTLSRTLKYLKGEGTALIDTGYGYMKLGSFEKSLENAEKSLKIFEKIGDKDGIGNSFHLLGNIYYQFGKHDKSLEYFQKALKYREETGDKKKIASTLGNIAVVYKIIGNLEKDLEYQLKALEIREEIGDERGIAISLSNIGHTYKVQGNFNKALEYFNKSLEISERVGNKSAVGGILTSIATTYGGNLKDFEKALEYSQRSLKIKEEIGGKREIFNSLANIGEWYFELKNYDKALEYQLKVLRLAENFGNKNGISASLMNIGRTYTNKHDYDKALIYLERSLKLTRENRGEVGKDLYGAFYELYYNKGDYKKAIDYLRLYSKEKDKWHLKERNKQFLEIQTRYETLKKEKEIEDLKKNNQIQDLLLGRQKMIRNVSIIFSLVVLIIAIHFFRRYRYLFTFWKKKNYIAHYKLINKIGSGGMGDIYKAQDIQDKSHKFSYAIKVLKEEYYKDEQYKTRFKNEAAMIDQLHHVNIVKVMERGEYEGTLYISMELLDGETLADLMEKEKQIDLKTALAMMIQMASAMVEIHKRGIIHRDLKPENIMVIRKAENPVLIKVLDFGLARPQNLTRLTRTGMIMGTIFYVSPEQLSRSKILPAGDIYSMGVIYYQVLTGEKPYNGDTAFGIARQILRKKPVRIEVLHPGIPSDLSSLVKKMMAKDPRKRPLANEVLKQLIRLEAGFRD